MTAQSVLPWREVLVLGAHPDDEMACAGLIARLVESGATVHHWFFSDCQVSTIARGFEPLALVKECDRSRAALGIAAENCGALDIPVREFPEHRQAVLDSLIRLRARIRPDLVLTAARADVHQDHATLTAEAIRAFKHTTILGYEMPWNHLEARHDLFVELLDAHLDAKLKAISCYVSQRSGAYTDSEFVRGLARVRGVQAGKPLAEAYEVIRWII